jgi:hypothetical protein
MSNYKKGREIDRKGAEGEKGKKYIFFSCFPLPSAPYSPSRLKILLRCFFILDGLV